MPGPFTVDPDEIDGTSRKIESALGDTPSLSSPGTGDVGHDGFASALTEFATRWQAGANHAQQETALTAATLRSTAQLYRAGDVEADSGFSGAK